MKNILLASVCFDLVLNATRRTNEQTTNKRKKNRVCSIFPRYFILQYLDFGVHRSHHRHRDHHHRAYQIYSIIATESRISFIDAQAPRTFPLTLCESSSAGNVRRAAPLESRKDSLIPVRYIIEIQGLFTVVDAEIESHY